MRVVVVGGAGFIGTHLVNKLCEVGHDVIVVDNLITGQSGNINPKAKFVWLDLSKGSEALTAILDERVVKSIIHLAAIPDISRSFSEPSLCHECNLTTTLNVLRAAANSKYVKRVTFTSSTAVYGEQTVFPLMETFAPHPLSPYAVQKLAGEHYMKVLGEQHGLETASLRLFNVYGEGQSNEGAYASVINVFSRQKKQGEPLTIIGDGNQTRDFVYVKDVVRALMTVGIGKVALGGAVFNICTGEERSVLDVAELFGGEVLQYLPERKGDIRRSVGNAGRTSEIIGFKSEYSLEQGLEDSGLL